MKWSEFIGHQHTHTQILLIFETDRPQHKISKYKHSQKTTGAWTIFTYCLHDKNGICQSELHYNFFRNFITIAQSQRFPYVAFMVSREEKETCSSTMSTGCWCWKAKRFNEQKTVAKLLQKHERTRRRWCDWIKKFVILIFYCEPYPTAMRIYCSNVCNPGGFEDLNWNCVSNQMAKWSFLWNGKIFWLKWYRNSIACIWKFDSSVCLSYKGSSI